jgi:ABC-type nitrate/sulfonate/bicarbonate transport system substrate-binding protein
LRERPLSLSFALTGSALGQDLKPISIATSSSSIPAAPARVAKELGLFEKHGLKTRSPRWTAAAWPPPA